MMIGKNKKHINILIPMAGRGGKFTEAGYAFPKPLIDIHGKTMIEIVVNNLRPSDDHTFIFVCLREHYEKYDLYNILKQASRNTFEIVPIQGATAGAALTALSAIEHVDNDNELIIANADQFIETPMDAFIKKARALKADGAIMTFRSSHPKWSYVLTDQRDRVLEVAEKKLISNRATVGIYYFKKGSDFVEAVKNMVRKNIRHNNEFYVAPSYNELLLEGKSVYAIDIPEEKMHGLGIPEDLTLFLQEIKTKKIGI